MKLELHAHTAESSGCGKMPAEELIGRYAGAGYGAVVITDHLAGRQGGNAVEDGRYEKWLSGWRAAKRAGERIGITVLHGAEVRFAGRPEDILVYGVSEADGIWLFELMDADAELSELYEKAHEKGMVVVQAHPFRRGLSPLDQRYLDGSEVYNGNPRHNNYHEEAHAFGNRGGAEFIKISGSDAHQPVDVARGGVIAPDDIRDNEKLVRFLRMNPDMQRIET